MLSWKKSIILPCIILVLSPFLVHTTSKQAKAKDDNESKESIYETGSYELTRRLLDKYDRRVRPVKYPNDPIKVGISGALYQIVKMVWNDSYLQWDPAKYNGAEIAYLPSGAIWIPELYLYYSINNGETMNLMRSGLDCEVRYNGEVRYFLSFTANTLCPLDVKYFPFDKQTCSLYFGSWTHPYSSVAFYTTTSDVNLNDFFDNQEWTLLNTSLGLYNFTYENTAYSAVELQLHIQRQSFYYIFNLCLPSALITAVALVGFHFPTSSNTARQSKFRLGIMTLLSMAVLLLSVVTDMPKFASSSQEGKRGSFSSVPLIGIYYFTLLALIGMGTVTGSIFVVIERHVTINEPPVPVWLQWLLPDRNARYSAWWRKNCNKEANPACRAKKPTQRNGDLPTTGSETTRTTILPADEMEAQVEMETATEMMATFASAFAAPSTDTDSKLKSVRELVNALKTVRGSIKQLQFHLMPKDNVRLCQWQIVLHRLERMSLMCYTTMLFTVLLLFFKHDWY